MMKVIGLFVVVFSIILIDRLLGMSDSATIVGVVVGAGVYILGNTKQA